MIGIESHPCADAATRGRRDRSANGRWLPGIVVAAAALTMAAPVAALTPAVLVRPDLEGEAVTVTGMRGNRLVYFDADRRMRNEPIDQFVQLRDLGDPSAADESQVTSIVELTDGQRIVGTFAGGDEPRGADVFIWHGAGLGDVAISLDQVRRIQLVPASSAADGTGGATGPSSVSELGTALSEDRVVLTNGDVLTGFAERVTSAGVEITPEGGQTLNLPLSRIAEVRLVNPPAYPDRADPREHVLTLRNGSRVRVADLELAAEHLSFTLPLAADAEPQRQRLPIGQVVSIDFTGAGWRLVDLAVQPMAVTGGGRVFGLSMPPRIEQGALFMHAPVTVAFDLPDRVLRFAAHARLDVEGVPPGAADWADFELIVAAEEGGESAGSSESRFHLSADQPRATINLPASGPRLVLELDAGVNGPILDRLRLDAAVLLVRVPIQRAADSVE